MKLKQKLRELMLRELMLRELMLRELMLYLFIFYFWQIQLCKDKQEGAVIIMMVGSYLQNVPGVKNKNSGKSG